MKRTRVFFSLFALSVFFAGCAGLPSVKDIKEPELLLADISFKEIKIGSMKFDVRLDIRNASSVPLYVEYLKADLFIAGSPLGTAHSSRSFKIDKFKSKSVKLEYRMGMFGAAQTIVQLIKSKDFSYTVSGFYTFNTKEGYQDIIFEKKGHFASGPEKNVEGAQKE